MLLGGVVVINLRRQDERTEAGAVCSADLPGKITHWNDARIAKANKNEASEDENHGGSSLTPATPLHLHQLPEQNLRINEGRRALGELACWHWRAEEPGICNNVAKIAAASATRNTPTRLKPARHAIESDWQVHALMWTFRASANAEWDKAPDSTWF